MGFRRESRAPPVFFSVHAFPCSDTSKLAKTNVSVGRRCPIEPRRFLKVPAPLVLSRPSFNLKQLNAATAPRSPACCIGCAPSPTCSPVGIVRAVLMVHELNLRQKLRPRDGVMLRGRHRGGGPARRRSAGVAPARTRPRRRYRSCSRPSSSCAQPQERQGTGQVRHQYRWFTCCPPGMSAFEQIDPTKPYSIRLNSNLGREADGTARCKTHQDGPTP